MVYMPQQFWDLRSCVAATDRLPRPTAGPDTVDPHGPKRKEVQAVNLLNELDAFLTDHPRRTTTSASRWERPDALPPYGQARAGPRASRQDDDVRRDGRDVLAEEGGRGNK